MIEWIEKLVKDSTGEGGVFNASGFMDAVTKEFPKHAVPKADFNAKTEELKTVNASLNDTKAALEKLKKDSKGNEDLKASIKKLQDDLDKTKASAAADRKTWALKSELQTQGVLDPDYVIYKMGGLEKFTFSDDEKPVGVADLLKPMREDKTQAHLFKAQNPKPYSPQDGGAPTGDNPFAKGTFNLTKQGELIKSNPTEAKRLAEAAGLKLG